MDNDAPRTSAEPLLKFPDFPFGGAPKQDPIEAKIQASIESGQITNTEQAYLRKVEAEDFKFSRSSIPPGQQEAHAKEVARRKAEYAKLVDRFIASDSPMAVVDELDLAKVSRLDRDSMSRQHGKLLAGVANKSISRAEFHQLVHYSLQTEKLRAKMREGGYTAKEREVIEQRLRHFDVLLNKLSKETSPEKDWKPEAGETGQEIDRIFNDALENGKPNPFGSSIFGANMASSGGPLDRLHSKAYGAAVLKRKGKVYDDERSDVRAAIARPTQNVETIKFGPVNEAWIKRLKEMFPAIDSNQDGKLDEAEVLAALRDPKWKGDDAKLLAATLQVFPELADYPAPPPRPLPGMFLPPLLGQNLNQEPKTLSLGALSSSGDKDFDYKDRAAFLSFTSDQLKDKASGPVSLYGGKAGPDIGSLQQGSEGDCWLLAALSSMSPEKVKQMVRERKDGKYELHLPGRDPEIVDAPTEAERNFYASSNGIWACVIEKGVGQILEREKEHRCDNYLQGRRVLNGGQGTQALEILTGVPAAVVAFNTETDRPPVLWPTPEIKSTEPKPIDGKDPKLVGKMLTKAFADGRPVCVATRHMDNLQNPLSISGHEYSVVGYDPVKKLVTLRNPWGGREKADNDGKDDGVFTMTLREFQASFSQMTVGRTSADQPLF